jgi:hypothetical protein
MSSFSAVTLTINHILGQQSSRHRPTGGALLSDQPSAGRSARHRCLFVGLSEHGHARGFRAINSTCDPCLRQTGSDDAVENATALLQLNPRASLEVFDYCRVTPEREHPEKFNALVREALLAQSATA